MIKHCQHLYAHPELYGEEKANIPGKLSMGGEDFSFFGKRFREFTSALRHTPGAPHYSSHNEHFVVDTDCFPIGMNVMITTALKFPNRK